MIKAEEVRGMRRWARQRLCIAGYLWESIAHRSGQVIKRGDGDA